MSSGCEAWESPNSSVRTDTTAAGPAVPHIEEFYRWDERVQRPFPDLRVHYRRTLAAPSGW